LFEIQSLAVEYQIIKLPDFGLFEIESLASEYQIINLLDFGSQRPPQLGCLRFSCFTGFTFCA
jgi:hypothetical protein